MIYYLLVTRKALTLSVKRAAQYRWDFLIEGGLSFGMAVLQWLPLLVLFEERGTVAGWSLHQMLVLMGWYTVVRSVAEGVIVPSLAASVAGVRTGLFDYTLMKPASTLFLCSVAEIRLWKIVDFMLGVGLMVYALVQLEVSPALPAVALCVVLSLAGLAALYALFVLAISASFLLVRIQNLTNVLLSMLDFSRWPIEMFTPCWRLVSTVVVPLGVVTSYPVMALLGMLNLPMAVICVVVSAALFCAARLTWHHTIRRYASASS